MGKTYDSISPEMGQWISRQRMFFVATAPLASDGHVNVSPKGGETFKILGPLEADYQDLTGSGAETAAHVRENGRITIMFCALEGPPRIVRLQGLATLVTSADARFAEYSALFPPHPGTRAFIHVGVSRVASSCGYGVPFFEFRQRRDALDRWAANKTPQELAAYRELKNSVSIDGLPAFDGIDREASGYNSDERARSSGG